MLQEPVLRAVNLSYGWALPPVFPDVRGALTEIIRSATGVRDDWAWDAGPSDPAVFAWNEERRLHILVQPRGIELVSEAPDRDGLRAVAEAVVPACLEILRESRLIRVGASATYLMAAGEITDASSALEQWLFAPELRTTLNPIGGRPSDLMLTLRFENDTSTVTTLRTEPLTDEQAAASPYFISDFEPSDFPPASVIANLMRSDERDTDIADGLQRAARHLEQVLAQGDKLLASVGVA